MNEVIAKLQCDASLGGESYRIQLIRSGADAPRYCLKTKAWTVSARDAEKSETGLQQETVEQWLQQLSHATAPVTPPDIQGCDGAIYRLSFYNGLNETHFQWWQIAPEPYRVLVDFANALLEAAGLDDRLTLQETSHAL